MNTKLQSNKKDDSPKIRLKIFFQKKIQCAKHVYIKRQVVISTRSGKKIRSSPFHVPVSIHSSCVHGQRCESTPARTHSLCSFADKKGEKKYLHTGKRYSTYKMKKEREREKGETAKHKEYAMI